MDAAFIESAVSEALKLGTVEVVVFTGGEPFCIGSDLYSGIAFAAQNGLLTRVVTNAVWATSPEKADHVMARLKDSGLTELNFSCDDFHQEHIPIERIRWAVEAAEKAKIPVLIASKGIKNSTINPAYLREQLGSPMVAYSDDPDCPRTNTYNYGVTVPVGWQSDQVSEDELLWPASEDCWKSPCNSVLKSLVIRPNGDLSICCGIGSDNIPEAVIGNILEEPLYRLIEKANNDLFVNWLAIEGPFGILQFLQKNAPDLEFPEKFINSCHLCHEVLSREDARSALSRMIGRVAPGLSLQRAWIENNREELDAAAAAHRAAACASGRVQGNQQEELS
jgi:organic radical activating enzyme